MAGWSSLTNGSGLDCVSHVTKDSVEGFCDPKDRLRCLFDLVLSGYLKEVTGKGFIRPMPPMLGNDMQSPDLLKLFLVVREIGGYEFVSKKGLWTFVVKELGFDFEVSASVKLIYAKYLHELEKWLKKRNEEASDAGNFCFLSLEHEEEFRGLFTNGVHPKGVCLLMGFIGMDATNRLKRRLQMFGDYEEKEKVCGNDFGPPFPRKEVTTRKRKRESLSRMLNWVIQVAKCLDDPSAGAILEPSKWKDHVGNEFWIQAIRAREALRRKRDDGSVVEPSLPQVNSLSYINFGFARCLKFSSQGFARASSNRLGWY